MFETVLLDQLASDECQQHALPFFCLYLFPIFSCLEQKVILPTKEECERITTSLCQVELSKATVFGLDHIIPDCNELPSSSDNSGMLTAFNVTMFMIFYCTKTVVFFRTLVGSGFPSDGLSPSTNNHVNCSPDFYLENSTCFPICQEWTQFSYAEAALVRGSAATASVVGIMGGIAVIIGSIIRFKSM